MTRNNRHDEAAGDDAQNELNRRSFLRLMSAGALTAMGSPVPLLTGADSEIAPAANHAPPELAGELFSRGTPEVFSGEQLRKIEMPVSGVCAGHVYLSGEGSLTGWRVDGHPTPSRSGLSTLLPLRQGFGLQTIADGRMEYRLLDQQHFPEMTFRGEYPIAKVEYRDAAAAVQASLEAFSPFIPLNADDSGLPATILNFTLKNVSAVPVEATLLGGLENGACYYHRFGVAGTRRNQVLRQPGVTVLHCTAEPGHVEMDSAPLRPDIIFEDWTRPTFDGWEVKGTGFGSGPVDRKATETIKGGVGGEGVRIASSFFQAQKDAATGSLTSAAFTISRRYIHVWMNGGDLEGKTCVRILVDGKPVLSQIGLRDVRLTLHVFEVRSFDGRSARIEIVDDSAAESGSMNVGRIAFSDRPGDPTPLDELPDRGTMSIALIGAPADVAIAQCTPRFDGQPSEDASVPIAEKLMGSLGRTVHLKPGESSVITFVVTWHFPSAIATWGFPGKTVNLGEMGRHYATKFASAHAVAAHVARNLDRLTKATRLWRDTWYDSTLPYWFLDRTFANASTLATSGCYRWANGRFYAFEGGPSSWAGTCTHVWSYAQSAGRLFPELERDTRERVDLGIALHPETGVIGFRAEYDLGLAVDGQAGTLLRIYREHQMSADDAFLKRNWTKIKQAYHPLFALDGDEDGILEGEQMNTLDGAWFGQIPWLSSLYVAALRAGEQMARESGDTAFAERCGRIAANGSRNIVARLYNGEHFVCIPDPKYLGTVNSGTGSFIDQVLGQSWAFQVGLPRILPEAETRSALRSIWKHNFTPNATAYVQAQPPKQGPEKNGDERLFMCAFPDPNWNFIRAAGGPGKIGNFSRYFNETWTGQEHQLAGHMLWEGMLVEAMTIERSIHNRYGPLKRNPWNETEAGNHYARAMASHGVFLAMCGFEHHGPAGHIGFAPRLMPESFRAPFTTAESWGTYAQTMQAGKMSASLEIKSGQLKLKTVSLACSVASKNSTINASLDGAHVPATGAVADGRLTIRFPSGVTVCARQKLSLDMDIA